MSRFVAVVSLFLVMAGVFAQLLITGVRDARMEAAQTRKETLNHTWQNLKTFEEDLNSTLQDVEGGLSLAEAIYRLESSSREHFPPYLINLHFLEKYPSVKEQVAHNIIRHFQVEVELEEDVPQNMALINRLEKELHQMFPGEVSKKTTF